MCFRWMITSFFVIYFFLPKATKKNTHPNKKNTHQQTKLLIQRKHVYAYDISFLCPPTILKSMCYFNSWQCSVVYLQDCCFFLEYTANELFQILALSIQGSIWFSYTFLPSYSWVGLFFFVKQNRIFCMRFNISHDGDFLF